MKLNKIIEDYVVSDQIIEEDIVKLKEAGFKTIFCNRPDNEEQNQVTVNSIRDKVIENGLDFIHQPVVGGQISQNDVNMQSKLVENLSWRPSSKTYTRIYIVL